MIDVIDRVLGGENFLAQDLGRTQRRFVAPDSERDRFADLLTWPALNELLNTHRLEPPRLRLSRGGEVIPPETYSEQRIYRRMASWNAPLPHLVAAQLRDGATLVLDAVEEMHPPIRDMVGRMEQHLRTGVQVNVYASWTAQEGFGVHWDDHDVIVLQIAGAKRWRIYGPTRTAPLYRDVAFDEEAPSQPIEDFVLRAGDALHVPRGWWHAAAASTGEPSLHLTCGLGTHSGVDLLSWLVDDLRVNDALRADLPRFADETQQGAWRDEMTKLLADRLAAPDVIAAYLSARDAAHRTRGGFSLPHAVNDQRSAEPSLTVKLTASRAALRHGDQTVILEAVGQRWTFDMRVRPLLEQILTGRPHVLGELAASSGITVRQAGIIVDLLLKGGVLAVEAP
ncbi:cupin domain-containing protein [Actinomadura hibisca]|uniref:cupin domain-containing protein n=1 Tax=Actinomadura hibisca TaxID=68565 RepID=UPI00082A5806|nr:cupin domain-containing protein [Actinomadura hibisca]